MLEPQVIIKKFLLVMLLRQKEAFLPFAGAPGTGSGVGFWTCGAVNPAKNMIGGDIDLSQLFETINNNIIDYLQIFFSPMPVDL